jgi:regulator of protease activity HflC (stomatin/prohibitin superfamily)
MGGFVFIVGIVAIGAAMANSMFGLGLPISFVYSPLFWIVYVVILTLASIIKFVRQQETLVVERLGRYNRTLAAGINIVWPIVERVVYKFDLREQVIDVPAQEAITKDNATVGIDGILYYKIVNARDAAYGSQNIARAIISLAQTTMRSTIGSMELDKTFENRDEINKKVVEAVAKAAELWGAQVTRYEIKDIKMPKSLQESMERQMKAERDKRATILESEGAKQSAINHATGEKESAILRATGEKEAAILIATGQAQAIKLVSEEIQKPGGEKAVQLEVAKEALIQYGHLAKEGNSLILMGDNADPSGFIAKAMAVLKTAGAQPVPHSPEPASRPRAA